MSRALATDPRLERSLGAIRAQLRDTAAVMALPGMWRGRPPDVIASGLLDVLAAILRPDLVFVRLVGPDGKTIERWRPQGAARPVLDRYLGDDPERPEVVTELAGAHGPLRLVVKRPAPIQHTAPLVAVASRRADFPTDSERFLLDFAVEQAGIAVDNAQLYARAEKARAEAERLQALAQRLSTSLDLDDVLQDVADTAAELLESPVAGVFLLDEGQKAFELVAGRGLDPAQDMRLEVEHSLAGKLIQSGRPEVVADVQAAPVTALPRLVSGAAVGALVVAPIISRSGPLGVVEVYSTECGAFEERHGELLAALAGAAAAVLENARLYRQRELDLARLRTILEQLPVGVMVVEPGGRVAVKNAQAERLFGAIAGEAAPGLAQGPLERAWNGGEVVAGERLEVERPDGGHSHVSVNAAPIRDSSGVIVAAVAVFDDVSGEEELRRQKEQFLAAAAHDLKTPLTSISGLVQLLGRQLGRLDAADVQRVLPMLNSIHTSAGKMTSLIDELLDVSRLDAVGRLHLNYADTDLVAVARSVLDAQRPSASEHELELVAGVDRLVGHWDASRLERVLSNLVGNAVKYSPDGGTVRLAISAEGDGQAACAVLSVSDDGIGIPAGDVDRIFDRFQRGSNVPQNLTGSGIGLAYVHQVVAEHGGSIAVTSQPGQGTTFIVRLPTMAVA